MQPNTATNSGQAMQNLQNYSAGMQTPDQAFQAANSQFGVQGAMQAAQGLRGAINRTTNLLGQVAPSVMGRTGGSLVTSAQANRMIANEQQPLSEQLSRETQDYNQAEGDYKDLAGQAESLANANLGAQQGQRSYLKSIYEALLGKEQSDATMALEKQKLQASIDAAKNSMLQMPDFSGIIKQLQAGQSGADKFLKGPNGVSQAQVNSANFLKQNNVNPVAVRNYVSQPVSASKYYSPIVGGLNTLGGGLLDTANATSNFIGKLFGIRK